jgi:hypothetical protein
LIREQDYEKKKKRGMMIMIGTVQFVCRGARHVDCTTYRNVRTCIQDKD